MKRTLLLTLLRLTLAGLFLYAGAVKAADPAAFAKDILSYQLLGHAPAAAIALYLPWLEILCGLFLALGRPAARRAAAILLTLLMLIFIAALLSAWWRGINIQCGCFGSGVDANYPWLLIRDAMLLVGLSVFASSHNRSDVGMILLQKAHHRDRQSSRLSCLSYHDE